MSEVVFLRHQGVPCAVPAHQVTGATRAPEGDGLLLFGAGSASAPIARCLEVVTSDGPRPLPCEGATFGSIEEHEMLPLSDVLAEELRMPHLVGVVDGDDEIVWLIDLMRWCNHE